MARVDKLTEAKKNWFWVYRRGSKGNPLQVKQKNANWYLVFENGHWDEYEAETFALLFEMRSLP